LIISRRLPPLQKNKEVAGFTGDETAAFAAKQSNVDVVAAYPITPQTIIVERFSDYVFNGEVQTEFVCVESEHSAMSACLGASAAGARVFTATASQGLALMHEVLYAASGMRLPIVIYLSYICEKPLKSVFHSQCSRFAYKRF
jgi:pyruvate ferredoxin oxidoreductase alpha subunit